MMFKQKPNLKYNQYEGERRKRKREREREAEREKHQCQSHQRKLRKDNDYAFEIRNTTGDATVFKPNKTTQFLRKCFICPSGPLRSGPVLSWALCGATEENTKGQSKSVKATAHDNWPVCADDVNVCACQSRCQIFQNGSYIYIYIYCFITFP